MRILRKTLLILSLLTISINPLLTQANTAVMNGWELTQTTRVGATTTYVAYKQTPAGTFRSTANIIPSAGTIAKFVGRASFAAAVGVAIKGLFGLIDYVMDPENNRVIITKESGLWMDYDRKVTGSVAVVGRYECAKPHGWGGGGGPIVKGPYGSGNGNHAYVKCNNGYGFIWRHYEKQNIPFSRVAAQIIRDAQAGKPQAVEAIGQISDELAKQHPEWLAAQFEKSKKEVEEKISPNAIALTQAHASGKKIGGNCTPGEHKRLEDEKKKYCIHSGQWSCGSGNSSNLSLTELRRRAGVAEQCAIYRTRINQKCFAGGDAGHRKTAREAWQAFENCTNKIHNYKGK